MKKAFLGFTVFIATLLPIGGVLADMLIAGIVSNLPSFMYYLLYLAMIYLPAAAATAWFFRSSQLASRVPLQVPGSWMLLVGSILMVIYRVTFLSARTIEGGGVSALVQELSPVIVWPGQALLAAGAARLLLSARSSNSKLQPDPLQAVR
jgi:drug/metabolite transporter (DMT)-like permease